MDDKEKSKKTDTSRAITKQGWRLKRGKNNILTYSAAGQILH